MTKIVKARISDKAPAPPEYKGFTHKSPALIEASKFLAKKFRESIDNNHGITLFGDFDVDGQASSAVTYLFCKLLGIKNVVPFTSKRSEGYGLVQAAVDKLISETPDPSNNTVILMDLGVTTVRSRKSS